MELEEAAVIDGCSQMQVFWKIILPLLKPSVSAVVILNGFGIWNNYAQAAFFLQDRAKHNVPQALSIYFQQFAGARWNIMAATAVIAIVPVVIVFLLFQKFPASKPRAPPGHSAVPHKHPPLPDIATLLLLSDTALFADKNPYASILRFLCFLTFLSLPSVRVLSL